MRILVITTSYPVLRDGSEAAGSFVEDFVKTLGENHKVAVVFPIAEKPIIVQDNNVFFYPFKVPKLPLSLLSPSKLTHWPAIISTLNNGQTTANKAVHDFRPDHILALWALPSGYWARNIYRSHGIPYSIWALGSDIWSLGKIPMIKSVLKNVLQHAQFRFADGYKLRDDVARISYREAHFMPSTRILQLVDTKSIKNSSPYNLAFLGRWHKNKGIDLLLNALQLLNDSDWRKINCFRIAGGGSLEPVVRCKVKALQDKNRPVDLSGFLDSKEAAEFLLTTDYLVIPSRIESIPVIFSDALQAFTPMVVTPVGDFPALFKTDPPGVLATEISSASIAHSIRTLLASSPQDFEANMQSVSAQFSVKNSVKMFIGKIT